MPNCVNYANMGISLYELLNVFSLAGRLFAVLKKMKNKNKKKEMQSI